MHFIRYLLPAGSRLWKESRSVSNVSKIPRITLRRQCGQVEKTQALTLDRPGISTQLSPGRISEPVWVIKLTWLRCHETSIIDMCTMPSRGGCSLNMNPLPLLFWPGSLSMGGDPVWEPMILQLWEKSTSCPSQTAFWGILVTGNCVQLTPTTRKLYPRWQAVCLLKTEGPIKQAPPFDLFPGFRHYL